MIIRRTTTLVLVAALGVLGGFGMTRAFGSGPDADTHRISVPDGGAPPDLSKLPEYVETLDRDGNVVGYTRLDEILPAPGPAGATPPKNEATPVYGPDFQQIVGHMYPGYGFVAAGEKVPAE